ncbi:unnamed protein product [Paramecium pentaurelia]|uniref:Uncharacterized protein n=1 Tax=Paramecium pentaurelia TaxID=43138 RepID=A0A8S1X614_9CILI|nr:unnamed protein product [Paramecium pentaurelia]
MFGFPFSGPFGAFPQFMDEEMDQDLYDQFPQQEDVDNKELYELLEIPPQSDIATVKQAYKTLAKKYHPDRPGGSQQKFQLIQKANEVLSDPEKKKIYDKQGKQGLLRKLNVKNQQFKKCDPYKLEHKITLKDVYQGAYHKKNLNNVQRTCESCQGQGGKQSTNCQSCRGQKIVQMLVEVQPGLNVVQQAPCPDCKGKGKIFLKGNECKQCKGIGRLDGEVEIEIPIEKGVPDGYCIKLYGKGNQKPGYENGDVHVYLQIEQHPQYIRKGTDLFYQKTISLKEALTGLSLELETLDDKIINVITNQIIKPNSIMTVKEKGLPTFKDELHFGDLHIQFNIEFPTQLNQNIKNQINDILPGPNITMKNANAYKLEEFQLGEFEKHLAKQEENEEDDPNQIRVDCSIF